MADEFKFGVEDVADKLGIEPASVRIKLRNAGIKKMNGNSYGWKTKAEVEEVVKTLSAVKAAPAKKEAKADKAKPAKADKKSDAKGADKAANKNAKDTKKKAA